MAESLGESDEWTSGKTRSFAGRPARGRRRLPAPDRGRPRHLHAVGPRRPGLAPLLRHGHAADGRRDPLRARPPARGGGRLHIRRPPVGAFSSSGERREDRQAPRRRSRSPRSSLQALLGGLTVLFLLPPAVSSAHAALAEIVFALTAASPDVLEDLDLGRDRGAASRRTDAEGVGAGVPARRRSRPSPSTSRSSSAPSCATRGRASRSPTSRLSFGRLARRPPSSPAAALPIHLAHRALRRRRRPPRRSRARRSRAAPGPGSPSSGPSPAAWAGPRRPAGPPRRALRSGPPRPCR